jgi:glycosyltransferase involved in cell wall biosynthesis
MNTIMILGIGPLAVDNTQKFHSGGNRAWHLCKPLLDKGHKVVLVCMRITGLDNQNQAPEEVKSIDNLSYYNVDEVTLFANDEYLNNLIQNHKPDAIVGACAYPASRAAAVAGDLPFWADIHGYPMGEAQAKAAQTKENGYLHHFWNIYRPVLFRADRFSVTSERQRMALIGELGAMGRLNQHTFCENFVTQIPIAWDEQIPFSPPKREKDEPLNVFFSGGYNNWCDVETLFVALEIAMEKDGRIRFISTGGMIDGHDEVTYPKFQKLVESSKYKDRYDLRGWVSRDELAECQQKAHLGINVDLPCYETLIGARNRITEFLARGIPVLSTLGTEISQVLFYKGAILTAPIQNPGTLAAEMILAANHPQKMSQLCEVGRKLFESQYTFHTTTKDFCDWCESPVRSKDSGHDKVVLDYRHNTTQEPSKSLLKRLFK